MGAMGSMGAKGAGATGEKRAGATRATLTLLGSLLTCVVACGPKTAPPLTKAAPTPATPAAVPTPAATPVASASEELPDGAGRQILNRACVTCHGLREVTKFRGFYTRAQWRDIVMTMVDYGAAVNDKDAEILTSYLAETLGKK